MEVNYHVFYPFFLQQSTALGHRTSFQHVRFPTPKEIVPLLVARINETFGNNIYLKHIK